MIGGTLSRYFGLRFLSAVIAVFVGVFALLAAIHGTVSYANLHTPIAAIYSPSHRLRTSRPKPTVANVELAGDAGTDPGPFRLSFLVERADVSASLFAYPDPKVGGGYFLLLAGLPGRST